MAKVFAAFADGWGRVLRAPAVLLGAFAVTWLVAYQAWRIIGEAPGAPAFGALDLINGLPTGFHPTYMPTLLGTERFLRLARAFLAGGALTPGLVAATATTLLVWTFLLGGILDRYARRRPIRAHAFFGASGVFFFRFLRLGLVAAFGYYLLFGLAHPLLFPPGYPWVAAGGAAVQSSPLLTPVYAVFLMFAGFWSAVVDYARIRAVVEDRRSMLGAMLAGWRFVTQHPLKIFGLYLLNAASFGALLWAAFLVLAGGRSAGGSRFAAAAAAAFYLFARLTLKLVFFASQTALFQRSLAHADYTASPTPLWPESPAAEEIINAAPRIPNPGPRIPSQ